MIEKEKAFDDKRFKANIFTKQNKTLNNFEQKALALFKFQAKQNLVYQQFLKSLNINVKQVTRLDQIPFLPVEFFKTQSIISSPTPTFSIQKTFVSSGTTAEITSQHHLLDLDLYQKNFETAFDFFYGDVSKYCILALLPAYLEREGSSLVYMSKKLIEKSQHPKSGFYLYDYKALFETLKSLEHQKQATILIGVTFALWDFAEQFPISLKHTIIMETGGMKGRRPEIIRPALHEIFKQNFNIQNVHSEYGMTELLSQAYSKGKGIFHCPPSMQVRIRETNDPFSYVPNGQTGAINIIDLANIYSCAFLATADLGKRYDDGSFEVLGRMDNSDVRGCNLLVNDF